MLSYVELWGPRSAIARVSRILFDRKEPSARIESQKRLRAALIDCMNREQETDPSSCSRQPSPHELELLQLAAESERQGHTAPGFVVGMAEEERPARRDSNGDVIAAVVSGVDINDSSLGMLNRAAMNGDVHVLELLVSCGADVTVPTGDGSFPLATVSHSAACW